MTTLSVRSLFQHSAQRCQGNQRRLLWSLTDGPQRVEQERNSQLALGKIVCGFDR